MRQIIHAGFRTIVVDDEVDRREFKFGFAAAWKLIQASGAEVVCTKLEGL